MARRDWLTLARTLAERPEDEFTNIVRVAKELRGKLDTGPKVVKPRKPRKPPELPEAPKE